MTQQCFMYNHGIDTLKISCFIITILGQQFARNTGKFDTKPSLINHQ